MWLKIVLLLTTLIVLCYGDKNTSCEFNHHFDWCGWEMENKQSNCRWFVKPGKYNGNKGYLQLKGASACSSTIAKKFGAFDDSTINKLTIEYYVDGPGPFSFSVLYDGKHVVWSCSTQLENNKTRTAHVSITGAAHSIQIKGEVATGSRIIITQIWDNLRNHTAQSQCPSLPTTTIPTTIHKTRPTTPTTARVSTQSSRPSVDKKTTRTGTNPESTTHHVQIEKANAQIQKERAKKMIIGGVVGPLVVAIPTVLVVIFIIMKRRKRTSYQPNQPKPGNTLSFENQLFN